MFENLKKLSKVKDPLIYYDKNNSDIIITREEWRRQQGLPKFYSYCPIYYLDSEGNKISRQEYYKNELSISDNIAEVDKVINWQTLDKSFNECMLGTSWKDSVIYFKMFRDEYITEILDMFHGRISMCLNPLFHTVINERGKARLISSLTIRDRVIQKTINQNFLLAKFVPTLIIDNVASLKNRGIDFGLERLKKHINRAYCNYGTDFYFMKLDIKSYFDSISHEYIMSLIMKKTNDPMILRFFKSLFYLYQYDHKIHNGEYVPYGIGLGGEVPQTFGIICLNELDHIIKQKFRIKGYVRYMDDMILIHNDKEYLLYIKIFVEQYLSRIGLQLNQNKSIIIKASEGVKFLKVHFFILENGSIYLKPDKKGIKRERNKLDKLYKKFIDLNIKNRLLFKDAYQNYSSFNGHLGRSDDKYQKLALKQKFSDLFIIPDELYSNTYYTIDDIKIIEEKFYNNKISKSTIKARIERKKINNNKCNYKDKYINNRETPNIF